MDWRESLDGKDSFLIQVKTGKRKTGILGQDEGSGAYVVAVSAPPVEGKANEEIEKFFTRLLKRPVRIRSGHASKKKRLVVSQSART